MKIFATNPRTIVVKTILNAIEVKYLLDNRRFNTQVNTLTDGSKGISYSSDLEEIVAFLQEI